MTIRDKDFRIFWLGQSVSWLGGSTQAMAQGWLVWSLTKSPAQLAITACAVSCPALLFSLVGGVIADRMDRRGLLIRTQGLSLLPALLLGIFTACGTITPSTVQVLAFLQGLINALDVPGRQAFLSELVPQEELRRAVVLNAVSFNATRMLGPVIAGCIIPACGAAPCFFFNAATFLIGAGSLILLRNRASLHPSSPSGTGEGRGGDLRGFHDLRDGFRFVMREREIRYALLLVALVSLLGIPFVPLLPVFADSLDVGARGLGAMSACAGSGSLLAALALALRKEQKGPGWDPAAMGAVFVTGLLLFACCGNYLISMGALFVVGAAMVVFLAQGNSFIQERCPDRLRGRVMGAYAFALLGMAPVGSALVGWLAARVGAAEALSWSATICLFAIGILSLLGRRGFGDEVAVLLQFQAGDEGEVSLHRGSGGAQIGS